MWEIFKENFYVIIKYKIILKICRFLLIFERKCYIVIIDLWIFYYKRVTKGLQKRDVFYWLFTKIVISLDILKEENIGGIILAIGDIIVGIDIGTSKVSTVVGEVNNFKQIEIICNTCSKCTRYFTRTNHWWRSYISSNCKNN